MVDFPYSSCATIFTPAADPEIHRQYRYSETIIDVRTGWSLDRDYRSHAPIQHPYWPLGWFLHGKTLSTPIHFTTVRSSAHRRMYGDTDAQVIILAHPQGYFPYAEALYSDALPFERVATMLNEHPDAALTNANRRHLVIVDDRDSHRAENDRLAALRSADKFQPLNFEDDLSKLPNALVLFAEPSADVLYNRTTDTVTNQRDGSSFTVHTRISRDEPSWHGNWFDAPSRLSMGVHVGLSNGYRPGFGGMRTFTVTSVSERIDDGPQFRFAPVDRNRMPADRLAKLLNGFPSREPGVGHSIVIDAR